MKRIGLLTTALIAAVLGLVRSFFPDEWASERVAGYFFVWPAVEAACFGFVAALGGAFVARVPFVAPVSCSPSAPGCS